MGKLWLLALTCFGACGGLCACSSLNFEPDIKRADAPFFFLHNERPDMSPGEALLEDQKDVYRPMEDSPAERANSAALADDMPAGCGMTDRFDHSAFIAYDFDDGHSRLALNMAGSVGFGGAALSRIELKFHYRFQPIKTRPNDAGILQRLQGLVGTIIHETFDREHNTLWDQLRDMNPLGVFGR